MADDPAPSGSADVEPEIKSSAVQLHLGLDSKGLRLQKPQACILHVCTGSNMP